MSTNKEILEQILKDQKRLEGKIDKIESALLGDDYEQRIGFLKQVAFNADMLASHDEQLNVLNEKIETKMSWKSLSAAGGGGVVAGYGITNWQIFMEWLKSMFHG